MKIFVILLKGLDLLRSRLKEFAYASTSSLKESKYRTRLSTVHGLTNSRFFFDSAVSGDRSVNNWTFEE